jgi:hypothetical protein
MISPVHLERMSDTNEEDNTFPGDPKKQVRSSPAAGCIIIMLAFAMFVGIAVYGIYAGFTLDADIAKFASEDKVALPHVEASNEAVNEVRNRLSEWGTAAKTGKTSEIRFTVQDLNILVANLDGLIDVRGTVYFDKIEGDRLHAQIAMPINRLAFWKQPRYLNGTCTMKTESAEGRIFLRFDTFDIPKAQPIAGFIERMQQTDLLAQYKENDTLKSIFNQSILSLRIEADTVVLETKPMN